MGKMLLDIFCLTFIVVFIVDVSGIVDAIKSFLSPFVGRKVQHLPPIDCSLCMTFWTCLVYIIATGHFTLGGLAIVCAASAAASTIHSAVRLVADIIAKLFQTIQTIFKL